jgi:integrase
MHGTLKRKYLHRPKDGIINFRVGGKTIARLPDDEHSAEFDHAYNRLMADLNAGKLAKLGVAKPGKVGHPRTPTAASRPLVTEVVDGVKRYRAPAIGYFVEKWLASDAFAPTYKENVSERPLRESTQEGFRYSLNVMRDMGMMDKSLHELTPRVAEMYLQTIKRERKSGSAAKMHKNLLSNIWKFARTQPEFDPGERTNPMHDKDITTPYKRIRPDGHEEWPEDVQDRFLKACDENLFLGFHLLLCTGQRVSDVVKMKWKDFDGTHISVVQVKTGKKMRVRVPKILTALLKKRERVHDNILTHKWKRPYTRETLSHAIKDVLDANGDGAWTTHGLRKNAGIMLAENGATVPQIMALLGHKSPTMALYYVKRANEAVLGDQAADILDGAFERRAAAKVEKNRAAIQRVK